MKDVRTCMFCKRRRDIKFLNTCPVFTDVTYFKFMCKDGVDCLSKKHNRTI